MVDSWVNSGQLIGADLHLALSAAGGRREALTAALRDAVRDGRLAPGTKLPPYRSLAADLGLARNTVAQAYAELVAEGWLTARQGSGTRVAPRPEPRAQPRARSSEPRSQRPHESRPHAQRPPVPRPLPAATHNLRQGLPDASAFPRNAWAASTRRAMNAAPDDAFGPTDPRGRVELRRALAEYLARARGVRTDAEHIVVCSGVAHALRILYGASGSAPVLGGRLAVESYGLPFHHSLLTDAGVTMQTIPVDEHGADPAALAASPHASRAVLLTPAHQFPTGVPLHPSRRTAFADWARGGRRLILEDDYDGEFRYDRQPVGALQALDPERVVYLGSASKSLSPGLRIGWMVLPDALLDAVLGAKGVREGWVGAIGQLTLADFIESGSYDKHVRRTRQKYRDRRDRLAAALDEHAPGVVSMTGIAAGLHAVLRLPAGTERSVLKAAAWHGVALDGLSSFAARLPAPAAPRRSVDASRRSAPSLRRPVDAPAREPSSLRRSVDSPVHPEPALQTLAARPDAFPEVSNPDGLVVGYAAPSDSAFPAALAALLRILPA